MPQSSTGANKVEYFYNKQNLEMTIVGLVSPIEVYFDNISFVEVDMIPFFLYATASKIDNGVKLPLSAIAPFI